MDRIFLSGRERQYYSMFFWGGEGKERRAKINYELAEVCVLTTLHMWRHPMRGGMYMSGLRVILISTKRNSMNRI